MAGAARITFYWRSRAIDVVDIPMLDAVNNCAFVSIAAPGWREGRDGGAGDELTILDEDGESYTLDIERVDGKGNAVTLSGYVRRAH
jgi:hypothetical protein